MPSFAEQSKRNLKAIKDGGSRPFFIACDGRRTEIFIAKNGTTSQFKDVTKINTFIGKNKLGEPLSAKAQVSAGTVQRAGDTCYFDISIKKGVTSSLLQKHLGLTKRVFQLTKYELGKPDASASSGSDTAPAPSGGPDLSAIKAKLKTVNAAGKNIASIIDGGLKRDGSGVANLADFDAVKKEMKQLGKMRSRLRDDASWLEDAIKSLKKATDKDSLDVRARLSKTLSRVKKLQDTVQSLGKQVLARKEELKVIAPLEQLLRESKNGIDRLHENTQNSQRGVLDIVGDGARLGMRLESLGTVQEVQAIQTQLQQKRAELQGYLNRGTEYRNALKRSSSGASVPAGLADELSLLMGKLDSVDEMAGNTITVVIDQTAMGRINDRLNALR